MFTLTCVIPSDSQTRPPGQVVSSAQAQSPNPRQEGEAGGGRREPACLFLSFTPNIYLFILFSAALGLHCCARAFSSCGERGPLFVVVCVPLIAVASLVVEHGALGAWASVVVAHGLNSCGAWAQ